MKVKVKLPFYDRNGLHKPGDIIDVKKFDPINMETVETKKGKRNVTEMQEGTKNSN